MAEIPTLVSLPREQYLRKEEARILSLAGQHGRTDPQIKLHHNAAIFAEDLYELHMACIEVFERRGDEQKHRIERHQRFADQAFQLRLLHLDHLANLLV